MAKISLITDWLTIGASGTTVDQREVRPQMLKEAAQTYDPDTYTAVINAEHWYGNFGTVRELRAVTQNKKTLLQARVAPNKRMLNDNDNFRLFTSMELMPNFAKTGKYYLTGLALTNKPASLGTTELQFCEQKFERTIVPGIEIEKEIFCAEATSENADKKGVVEAFCNIFTDFFKNNNETSGNNTLDKEHEFMTPEQFTEFMAAQDKLNTSIETLTNLVKKDKISLSEDEKAQAAAKAKADAEAAKLTADAEAAKLIADAEAAKLTAGADAEKNNAEVVKTLTELASKMDAVTEKLTTALGEKPSKKIPPGTGGEGETLFV